MDVLRELKATTPEKCRDMVVTLLTAEHWQENVDLAVLLLDLGARERTTQWHKDLEAARDRERHNFEILSQPTDHHF
ncbi:MAG: hypothetical protein ABJF09_12405 [Qipengyuania citrea]|uniref:hypothetical protein n=1 Tax=Alphaproteobacteria TaxID=28211 RepID=UPI001E5268C2|nr:hypothetical protein [Qipengyuania citrea]MCD1591236.1 hypothetical protein [Qipengyuania citrea]